MQLKNYQVTTDWTRCTRGQPKWNTTWLQFPETQPLIHQRRCLNILIFVLILSTVVLLRLVHLLTQNVLNFYPTHKSEKANSTSAESIPAWPTGFYPHNTYGFHPVNERGVYSFWNVCIEAAEKPFTRSIDYLGKKLYFYETAKITVYNSFYRNGQQRLHVSGSHNSHWNHWDVFFKRGQIPQTYTFHNTTAFFVVQTCPANLHHFWIDEFVSLHGVVQRANRLYPGADNQILYRLPTDHPGSDIHGCYNKTVYEDILQTLYISSFHDVFYRAPLNECYSSAVFGAHPFVTNPRVIINHVIANVLGNVTLQSSRKMPYFVTFVQRHFRRILNIRELLNATLGIGFRRVRIIDFERHPVAEQIRIAATSCIMIGVQGAGLQWAVFMPRGCTLIEVAWPAQHWGFHFRNFVEPYGITYFSLRATNARVNWQTYEMNVRNGKPVPLEERIRLLQQLPRSPSVDNIWKWADAFVSKERLFQILAYLDPYPAAPSPVPSFQ